MYSIGDKVKIIDASGGNLHYVFRGKDVDKFKFCPLCGGEILEVYIGDYEGHTTCGDCDEDLSFVILEEMVVRFPKWIEKAKK